MMKQTKYILPILSLFFIFSCSTDDKVIDEVLSGVETGAILRTLSVNNAILNSSDPTTQFSVTVEEQDEQDGALFESVDIYVSISDGSPDNGVTVVNDAYIKTIPASDFTNGPNDLPVGTLTATFGEAEAAMNLTSADHAPGDVFVFELRVNLTDGRIFGASSASGIITGGFFSSPFLYNTLILCSPASGDYTVEMHDSYGDGWQTDDGNGGSGISVDIDGTIVQVGMCSPYGGSNIGTFGDESLGGCTGPASTNFYDATGTVTIPVGTESAIWSFPGDFYGEISFEVYGPGGEELYVGAQGATGAGLLPITLCGS